MNTVVKTHEFNKEQCDKLIDAFNGIGLDLTYVFFKSGQKDTQWFDGCTGLDVKLNNRMVFIIRKSNAIIKLNKIPEDKRNEFVEAIHSVDIFDAEDSAFVIPLGSLFLLILGFGLLPFYFEKSIILGYVACGSVSCLIIGTLMLMFSNFTLGKNPLYTSGLVIFALGMLVFSPVSLLLKPFLMSIVEEKLPKYLGDPEQILDAQN
ncbi:hypothetical protein [Shewanella surugensis]|uniref:Uncharacterized protein n=1 Tax=Shewanella surugensis TaxID=212020 RepID=A0ABT0LB79_9GAMM|nr:hypothetical protein [Shewanella surugensis]MCL1124895.1 hypothetical protein [Shewanella surugensis]